MLQPADGAASVPWAAVRVVVLGVHGSGRHGGPGLPVVSEATVQLVANDLGIVEVQRHQRGRDMARETFDDEANLLDVGFNVVGGARSNNWDCPAGSARSWELSSGCGGSGRRPAGNMYPGGRRRDRVVVQNQAASGQRSRMRSIAPAFGTNTRVRQETISTEHPMRFSAGRSVSAGPWISDPVAAHERRREPPAVGERERIAALHDRLEGLGTRHGGAAAEPEARPHAATCSASSTRPMRGNPSSE